MIAKEILIEMLNEKSLLAMFRILEPSDAILKNKGVGLRFSLERTNH